MGQVEVNNAFLLGMASKGVLRVREVVENGYGGGLVKYREITSASEDTYRTVAGGIAEYYKEAGSEDTYRTVAGGIVEYSVME